MPFKCLGSDRRSWVALAALLVVLSSCRSQGPAQNEMKSKSQPISAGSFALTSPDFADGGAIPKRFTCEGANTSPELAWSGPPAGTESLALIVDDPDAPSGTFTHWTVFDIPKDLSGLEAGVPNQQRLAPGFAQGENDFGKVGYGGPCPPPGKPHQYMFQLYALSQSLGLQPQAGRVQINNAMKGKVLGEASLTGTFGR